MKNEFPKFLRSAGFDDKNITWCAGLHENTNHRHIHFAFFENEPTRHSKADNELHFSKGKINMHAVDKMKINCELRLTSKDSLIVKTKNQVLESFKKGTRKSIKRGDMIKKVKQIILILPTSGRLS